MHLCFAFANSGALFYFVFSKNFVFLQVGYKSISYELHEQQVAFGSEALFGNLFCACILLCLFTYLLLLFNSCV